MPRPDLPDGSLIVEVCFDKDGAQLFEPKVVQSSGNPNLDAAAIDRVRNVRFKQDTDGKNLPANCKSYKAIFKCANRQTPPAANTTNQVRDTAAKH